MESHWEELYSLIGVHRSMDVSSLRMAWVFFLGCKLESLQWDRLHLYLFCFGRVCSKGWPWWMGTWTLSNLGSCCGSGLLLECQALWWFRQADQHLIRLGKEVNPPIALQSHSLQTTHQLPGCSQLHQKWAQELCNIVSKCKIHSLDLCQVS